MSQSLAPQRIDHPITIALHAVRAAPQMLMAEGYAEAYSVRRAMDAVVQLFHPKAYPGALVRAMFCTAGNQSVLSGATR